MTISNHIKRQYFADEAQQLIRLAPSQPAPLKPTKRKGTPWTDEEHNRFLEALERFPAGPWKRIAEHVNTRTTRQTMTHAQRYREKIARRRRILREAGLPTTHLADDSIVLAATSSSPSTTSAKLAIAAAAGKAAHATIASAASTDTTTRSAASVARVRSRSHSRSRRRVGSTSSSVSSVSDSSNSNTNRIADSDSDSGSDDSEYNDAFDLIDIEFEDIEDVEGEQLLLSLVESYEPLPFSEEDAHWLVEHYSTISLQTPL